METDLPNPVIKAEDADKAELRRLVEAEDNRDYTEESTPEPTEKETQRAELAESEKPESEKVEPEKQSEGEPARDDLGRFTKADGTKSEPNEAAPKKEAVLNTEGKPDSNFEKAKKEQVRKERTWQNIEAEKQAVRQDAERLRQEREAWEQQRQQFQQKPAPDEEFTSKQYEGHAAQWVKLAREQRERAQKAESEGDYDLAAQMKGEAAGNFDLADRAMAAANGVREKEYQAQAQQQQQGYQKHWLEVRESTLREHPEIIAPNSAIAKQMNDWLQQDSKEFEPIFHYDPNGFRKCYQIAQWKIGAEQKEAAEQNATKLKARVEQLEKYLAPLGGSPTERTGPMSLENMTHEQQKAALREAAIRQDSQAA